MKHHTEEHMDEMDRLKSEIATLCAHIDALTKAAEMGQAERRVLMAAVDLCPSEGTWKDEPRMKYDEVQIDKSALTEFMSAVAALIARAEAAESELEKAPPVCECWHGKDNHILGTEITIGVGCCEGWFGNINPCPCQQYKPKEAPNRG